MGPQALHLSSRSHNWIEYRTPKQTNNNQQQQRQKQQKRGRRPQQSAPFGTLMGYNSLPVPSRVIRPFRYAETLQYTTGAAGIVGTANLFRLNSLFDPNQTGVGHQPYGFDQMAAFYTRYRVHSVRVTNLFTTIGSTADVCCIMYISSPNGFVTITGITTDAATERNNVATRVLSPSGNTRTAKLTATVNLWEIVGLTKQQYLAEENYNALVSANPTLNIPMSIGISSYSGVGAEQASVQTVIEYLTELYDPLTLAQS